MNTRKEFFKYVLPSMLAFALSGIYSIADGFFVGNALGDHALAAINMAYPLTAFIQAAGTGIGMGGAVHYAICRGNDTPGHGRRYFGMTLILLVSFSALLTVLFLAGSPAILQLFGASGDIKALASEYMLCIACGAFFQIMGTGLVPLIRNMGGSVAAMAAMITGFITNIVLDYLFVWRLTWGMSGAAIATVIGQAMTFLACLVFLLIRHEKPELHFEGHCSMFIKNILKVGLSPFGLTFSPNITLILINKSAAMVGGAAAVTCYAPISYISSVIFLLLQGVSDGSQPLLSLSYGEGNMEKTKAVRNLAYRFALFVSVLCMVVLYILRGQAAALFGASGEITQNVAGILPIFLSGYLFIAISRVTTAYFYATGTNLKAFILIYGEPLALLLLLLVLPHAIGLTGTWLCVPLSQITAALLSLLLTRNHPAPQIDR